MALLVTVSNTTGIRARSSYKLLSVYHEHSLVPFVSATYQEHNIVIPKSNISAIQSDSSFIEILGIVEKRLVFELHSFNILVEHIQAVTAFGLNDA